MICYDNSSSLQVNYDEFVTDEAGPQPNDVPASKEREPTSFDDIDCLMPSACKNIFNGESFEYGIHIQKLSPMTLWYKPANIVVQFEELLPWKPEPERFVRFRSLIRPYREEHVFFNKMLERCLLVFGEGTFKRIFGNGKYLPYQVSIVMDYFGLFSNCLIILLL